MGEFPVSLLPSGGGRGAEGCRAELMCPPGLSGLIRAVSLQAPPAPHLAACLNFSPLPISPMECHYFHMNQQFVFGKGGGEIGRRMERVG